MILDAPDRFDPLPEGLDPAVPVPGYPNTWTHTPSLPAIRRPATRTEATGPLDLWRKLPPDAVFPEAGDLARLAPGRVAQGQLIHVSGRILDEDSRPVRDAVVELWQANAAGRYFHPIDQRDAPLDPDFVGNGRVRTDAGGRYAFFTIKPGAYPVPVGDTWWRPPHIHFSVLGPSSLSRLVTQMYFPGDPMNAWDRILNSMPDGSSRARLVATQIHPREIGPVETGGGHLGFAFDIVLRGRHATPPA